MTDGGPWRSQRAIAQGAEAMLEQGEWMGRPAVLKLRRPKGYRHPDLETSIRAYRTRNEARALREARSAGVRTPAVLDMVVVEGRLVLERVEGPTLRACFDGLDPDDRRRVARALGGTLGALHRSGMVHGDPTTSNFILEALPGEGPPSIAVLDISLGGQAEGVEERGVDLRLLSEAFGSTHHAHADMFATVMDGYAEAFPEGAGDALARMDAIAARGRYVVRPPRGAEDREEEGA